jgi:glycosyltransferase involved in cell wall biosynthesis
MRVLMICKACIVGIYQLKLEATAQQGIELCVLVPPSWRDERGNMQLERVFIDGYEMREIPIWLNGNFHLHVYPTLGQQIRDFRPDIVHIDEEPYNLAAWQALYHANRIGAKTVLFSWQNIRRIYPPPFAWGEKRVLSRIDHLIAGTDSAAQVWRDKGYMGDLSVIPQFGTDADLFHPAEKQPARPFTMGYVGRLVPEKGVDLLLQAAGRLKGDWRLKIVGGGPMRDELARLAQQLKIADRVDFSTQIPSTAMPEQIRRLDALVLPSVTRSNWKEQFGRVLVEAMMSGVPVVGSDSGAIPDVIGDAGLIFPEGDVAALAAHLCALQENPILRAEFATQGRERALTQFTHDKIAAATVEVYRALGKYPHERDDF